MQRKIHFLIPSKKKKGFMLIYAIGLIVLVSTVLMVSLNLSAESSKRANDTFISTQAQLLAMSASEQAIFRASHFDRAANGGNCLYTFTMNYPESAPTLFDISVTMRYIGFNCTNADANLVANITTPDAIGTVMIDVFVSANAAANLDAPFNYHRRSVQKL